MEALLDTLNSASAAFCERIGMPLEGVRRLEFTKGRMDIPRDQRSFARIRRRSSLMTFRLVPRLSSALERRTHLIPESIA